MLFDNQVDKVKAMLDVMKETGTNPEFECFDVGIVRSVGMYKKNGMTDHLEYNFVMGWPRVCQLMRTCWPCW